MPVSSARGGSPTPGSSNSMAGASQPYAARELPKAKHLLLLTSTWFPAHTCSSSSLCALVSSRTLRLPHPSTIPILLAHSLLLLQIQLLITFPRLQNHRQQRPPIVHSPCIFHKPFFTSASPESSTKLKIFYTLKTIHSVEAPLPSAIAILNFGFFLIQATTQMLMKTFLCVALNGATIYVFFRICWNL